MDFAIEKKFDGTCWQVMLSGEVDIFNSTELKTQLTQLMDKEVADIHIDCTKLEYIDSTGLGAMVGVLKNINTHGKEMHLSAVKSNILKLFRITNLDKVFIIDSTDESQNLNREAEVNG